MIGICIITYNTWKETIKCINTILNSRVTNEKYVIYLLDNASTVPAPHTIESLIKNNDSIVYLNSGENKGYNAGMNYALRQAIKDGCDFMIVCNNDIYFEYNSINHFKLFYDNHKGVVYPKVYLLNGKESPVYNSYPTCILEWYLRRTKLGLLLKKKYSLMQNTLVDYDAKTPIRVHLNQGACFALDRFSAQKLLPFDENVFLYCEEEILGYNADKKGIPIFFLPDSVVYHGEGKSTHISPLTVSCMYSSSIYYLRKYLKAGFFQTFPMIIYFYLGYIKCMIKYKSFKGTIREFNVKMIRSYYNVRGR